MNALLDLIISGQITQDEYAQKKRSFLNEKMDLQDKVAAFERQSVNRFEPEINFYREAAHVGEIVESGKPDKNRAAGTGEIPSGGSTGGPVFIKNHPGVRHGGLFCD